MAELDTKIQNTLDESRILILGTQMLMGFQYRSALESGFDKLSQTAHQLELAGLGLLTVTLALLMSPVPFHHLLEDGEDSPRLNGFGSTAMGLALLPFAFAMGARPMQSAINTGIKNTRREASVLAPLVFGYLIVAVAGAAALAVSARKVPYYGVDLKITRTLQSVNAGWFDRLMRFVCGLGYPIQANILGAVIMGYMYRAGYRLEAQTTVIATVGSLVIAGALIMFANRPRPTPDLVRVKHKMWTTSFPSGHTLIFTAVGGFLGYLVWNSKLPALVRLPLLGVFGAVVFLMGPARVYSGEHWASDVVAGYLAGSAWLAVLIKLYRRGKTLNSQRYPHG